MGDAEDLVEGEPHLVVQEEAEAEPVVLHLDLRSKCRHLAKIDRVQLGHHQDLLQPPHIAQDMDEPLESLIVRQQGAPHIAVALRLLQLRHLRQRRKILGAQASELWFRSMLVLVASTLQLAALEKELVLQLLHLAGRSLSL